MAITDTTPTSEAAPAAAREQAARDVAPSPGGFAGLLGTADHKTIGRLYVAGSLVFGIGALVLTGVFSLVGVSASLADSLAETSFQLFTLSRFSLVLLFVVPLFVGIATAIVPLQIGAATVAFPRAAAAAFWAWGLSAGALLSAYVVNGGVAGGSAQGQELAFLALVGLCVSLLVGTVCVVTTAITMRAPGMSLDRTPLFTWSMIVAGAVWMLTLPAFVANVALVFIDIKYGAPGQFGVDHNQWAQLAWMFTQPAVFAFAIPALGILADIGATFARTRQPQRGVMIGAIGAFGAFSVGAWAQPGWVPGVWHSWIFVGQSALVVLPLLMVLAGTAMAMRKGQPKLKAPALLGLCSLLLLLLGALAAVPFGVGRLDLWSTPTAATGVQAVRDASGTIGTISAYPVYAWGQSSVVLTAAALAAMAALFYWGPKLVGATLPDGLGKALAPLTLLAGLVFGGPMLVLGFANRFDSLGDASSALFGISVAGAALVALALLAAGYAALVGGFRYLKAGPLADDDAWGFGQTLEWACASPPATGNFGTLAEVASAEPLLDGHDEDEG